MARIVSVGASHSPVGAPPLGEINRRELLCVGDGYNDKQVANELNQISNTHWNIQVESGFEKSANVLKNQKDILVGLILLSTHNCDAAEQFVSSHNDVDWIALINEFEMSDQILQRTLSHYFYDYHTLPIDTARLEVVLGHAYGMASLRRACPDCVNRKGADDYNYHHMIGTSDQMMSVYGTIDKVAPTDYPVLITGPSGTGKELVAEAIHERSGNSGKPLIILNCGAIPEPLIQSELFGHEKGAFTTADKQHKGYFESAHGGTIFLDEIGELPLSMQANLLRVIEERVIRRVGGTRNVPSNVRVIAATNKNLEDLVREGKFREDLYYRLSVVTVVLPALCHREGDVEALARHYLSMIAPEVNAKVNGFSSDAVISMLRYSWPGNVRELINRIKRALLVCESRLIRAEDLELETENHQSLDVYGSMATTLKEAKEDAERNLLVRTLDTEGSNVTLAAKKLGVSRVTLYNLIKKYDLSVKDSA